MSIKRSIVIGATDTKQTDDTKKKRRIKRESGEKETVTVSGKVHQKNGTFIMSRKEDREPRVFNPDGKWLVIVESPAKSKTIEKFLGDEYIVKASMGHLRDLPQSQMGVDIEHDFTPRYSNLPGRKKVIEELCADADEAKGIFLATDPDREGEAISWHLAYILNVDTSKSCRITFNEITKSAVAEALENPRLIDMNMVNAQQARRILDRIVGYRLSPMLWKKVCKGLSAGRVQSVAVRLVCEREREIQAFIPEEYWSIEGTYETTYKEKFVARLTHKGGKKVAIANKEEAQAIQEQLEKQEAVITAVERRKRSRRPAPPFTTSTLQQEGVRKLNFGAKRTMMIAQHLYEGMEIGGFGHVGLITYMRTDSTRIAKEMADAVETYIRKEYGDAFYPKKRNLYGVKENSQDAHEAIRPTMLELPPHMLKPFLSTEELKLYTLIWNRFIASQMAAQESETVTATMESGAYKLRASGRQILFKGFTEVYEDDKKDDAAMLLPDLKKNDRVKNISINPEQHFTQPPARYSEASLIKTLEEKGIGRPSTYAPIIDTIMARNYVEKQNRNFVPTELGFVVVDFLVKHFSKLINVDFTAHLEEELDEIANGKETYLDVMKGFYSVFEEELKEADDAEKVHVADEPSEEICELCGSPMVYKFGRFGRFLACSRFPECKNTKPITVSTGVTCPKCGQGEIVERKSRRGRVFYGCSRYPACDFTLWDKPVVPEERCSTCGSLMVERTYKNGTSKKFCSNEACPTRPKRKPRKKKVDTEEIK